MAWRATGSASAFFASSKLIGISRMWPARSVTQPDGAGHRRRGSRQQGNLQTNIFVAASTSEAAFVFVSHNLAASRPSSMTDDAR